MGGSCRCVEARGGVRKELIGCLSRAGAGPTNGIPAEDAPAPPGNGDDDDGGGGDGGGDGDLDSDDGDFTPKVKRRASRSCASARAASLRSASKKQDFTQPERESWNLRR